MGNTKDKPEVSHEEMFKMEREGGWIKIPDSQFAHPVCVSSHTHHSAIKGRYVRKDEM